MDNLKGQFYLSDKQGDKLFQEGVFTIFNEIDQMKNELDSMLRPNGSQSAPARSCYDLFLCNPKLQEGYYWIDPNLGSPSDAAQVYCSRPGCSCVDYNIPEERAHTWSGQQGTPFSELPHSFQLTSEMAEDQLSLLRLLSSHGWQMFSFESSGSGEEMEFIMANGEVVRAGEFAVDKLSDLRTAITLEGEPELFPMEDFITKADKFGFELGRSCFCNSL